MPSFVEKAFHQDLISLAVLVAMPKKGYGSGIFIMKGDKIYFATARHVLFLMKKVEKKLTFTPKTKKIDLIYYALANDFTDPNTIEVDLEGLFKANKMKLHGTSDVVVFEIGEVKKTKLDLNDNVKLKSGGLVMNMAKESMIRMFDGIETGSDIFVVGYPKALGMQNNPQYNFNHPLVRRGIVAGKNRRRKTVIIDCPVHGGNSGGPVFITEKIIENDKGKMTFSNKRYLIGLVTEFIPYVNKAQKNTVQVDNADFAVIVPLDHVLGLIKMIV